MGITTWKIKKDVNERAEKLMNDLKLPSKSDFVCHLMENQKRPSSERVNGESPLPENKGIGKLRDVLNAQAIELKFIKDVMIVELEKISAMDSALTMKPALLKFIDSFRKKAAYELEKLQA